MNVPGMGHVRRGLTHVATGAWQSVLAAVRPQRTGEDLPWTRGRRAARLVSVALGVYGLIAAVGTADVVLIGRGIDGGLAFACLLPMVAALAFVPYRPVPSWLAVTCWMPLLSVLLPSDPPAGAPVLEPWNWLFWVPALLFAAWAAPRRALPGVLLVSSLAMSSIGWGQGDGPARQAWLAAFVGLVVPLAIGAALGTAQRARTSLQDEQERAQEALARQGALVERARIAREMHDIVAHSMSMIAVRAETAQYRLGAVELAVRDEFAEVASAARQSLTEMQHLLSVLRADDGTEHTPQPGLQDVRALLPAARAAGAQLTWELDLPDVPAALGLSAYRIVQQGIANVAQHAPGASTCVSVRAKDDVLRVAVINGPGATTPASTGGGSGLIGLRERAALHGGTVRAGPTSDGGFRLVADLPIWMSA